MSGLLEMEASASSPSSSSFDSSWAQYDQEVALAELSQPPFEGFQATKTAVVRKQPPTVVEKGSLNFPIIPPKETQASLMSQDNHFRPSILPGTTRASLQSQAS